MSALRRVVVRAPGRVTPYLALGAADEDGHHQRATVLQALDLEETITAERAEGLHLEVDSEGPGEVPRDATNLVLRAAALLREHSGEAHGAALHLHTRVPIAAGLGGGSADAAATLVALNRLWGLDLPAAELRELGRGLDAEVPFAMLGHTMHGHGGELTTVLTHGHWTWLLALPEGSLTAAEVLARHDEIAVAVGREIPERPAVDERVLQALGAGDAQLLGQGLHNDLTSAAFALHGGLEALVEAAEQAGAAGAMVCGSGPAVAVLVEDAVHGQEVEAALRGADLVRECHLLRGSVPGAAILEER